MKLSKAARELATKVFTISNLGQDHPGYNKSPTAINQAWNECLMAHESEGIDITEEHLHWKNLFDLGDKWCTEEALKEMPWLKEIK